MDLFSRFSKYQILAVDRQPEHVETIRTTLAQGQIVSEVVAIANPKDVLSYLNRQGQYAQAVRPHLILFDLNCFSPNDMDSGLALLETIKGNPELRQIPIIILTVMADEALIHHSYMLQSNCYILKPSNVDQLAEVVKRIENFWLRIVTLPVQ